MHSFGASCRHLGECDERLAKYRAALEAGADPAAVAARTRDVENDRSTAKRDLAAASPAPQMTAADVRALVSDVRDVVTKLAKADPATKAALFDELGIPITYEPDGRFVVEAHPRGNLRVGGGT
jgi:site-specific DNA recombinase